ncbi:MAG: FAD-dependent oxidoreductase [Limnochordia bacterium]
MKASALVIGGGPAGLGAALELAGAGIKVYLVEKEAAVGGWGARYVCKATDKCRQCSACLIPEKIQEVYQQPLVEILTNTQVVGVEGEAGSFQVRLQREQTLDPALCNACGKCLEVCPKGAIDRLNPWAAAYRIDKEKCVAFAGEDCDLCARACPTGAINFQRPVGNLDASVELVVAATGHQPFDARRKYRLGYGRFPRVITGLELEEALNEIEGTDIFGDGRKPLDVAFIQCVGSRDVQEGAAYCSRVCCKYALRLAGLMRHREPETQVTFYYMDIQTGGKGFAEVYQECRDDFAFVRGIPARVEGGDRLKLHFDGVSGQSFATREHDLVVLSVGITPSPDNAELARLLTLNRDEHGFLKGREGIYVAGTAAGPRDISESLAHGMETAANAIINLEGREG